MNGEMKVQKLILFIKNEITNIEKEIEKVKIYAEKGMEIINKAQAEIQMNTIEMNQLNLTSNEIKRFKDLKRSLADKVADINAYIVVYGNTNNDSVLSGLKSDYRELGTVFHSQPNKFKINKFLNLNEANKKQQETIKNAEKVYGKILKKHNDLQALLVSRKIELHRLTNKQNTEEKSNVKQFGKTTLEL